MLRNRCGQEVWFWGYLLNARWIFVCHIIVALALAGCASSPPDPAVQKAAEERAAANAVAARQAAEADNKIIIGVAGPMTGDLQAFGEQLRRGAEKAVADINAAGGVMGRTLQLEVADDECGVERADDAARELVGKGVVFVDGHFCSGSSIRGSKIYVPAGILQITPSSSNALLTDNAARNKVTTLLRVVGRDEMQADLAADYLLTTFPGGPIAVLSDGSPYGKGIATRLLARLDEKGVKPAIAGAFAQGQSSYANLIAKMKEVQPKAIYVAAYQDDVGRLTWAIRTARLDTEIIGPDYLNNQDFWSYSRGAGTGVRFSDALPAVDRPEAAEVAAAFHAEGIDPAGFTLNAYAAVQVFAAAAEATKGTDAVAIGAYLRQNSVKTVLGELSWDAKGDLTQAAYIWYVWRDGAPQRQ